MSSATFQEFISERDTNSIICALFFVLSIKLTLNPPESPPPSSAILHTR